MRHLNLRGNKSCTSKIQQRYQNSTVVKHASLPIPLNFAVKAMHLTYGRKCANLRQSVHKPDTVSDSHIVTVRIQCHDNTLGLASTGYRDLECAANNAGTNANTNPIPESWILG